jgi:hypothetical protein
LQNHFHAIVLIAVLETSGSNPVVRFADMSQKKTKNDTFIAAKVEPHRRAEYVMAHG